MVPNTTLLDCGPQYAVTVALERIPFAAVPLILELDDAELDVPLLPPPPPPQADKAKVVIMGSHNKSFFFGMTFVLIMLIPYTKIPTLVNDEQVPPLPPIVT